MAFNYHFELVVLLVGVSLVYYWKHKTTFTKKHFPPGPKPLPIVGNVFDMPKTDEWVTYGEWMDKYGDIVFLRIFSTPLVILNTFSVANALLEKRGLMYAGRPHLTMAVDLGGWDWGMGFMQYNSFSQYERRLVSKYFGINVIEKYRPKQLRAAHRLLQDLIDSPSDFMGHIHHAVGSSILDICYGYHTTGKDDQWMKLASEIAEDLNLAVKPGEWIVDLLPFLRHLPDWCPGAGFKRIARDWRMRSQKLINEPFESVRQATINGDSEPCVVVDMLEDDERETEFFERAAKEVAAVAMAAGTDTTTITLHTFVLQMMLNPDVQLKAQAELDSACYERLPRLEDRPMLPYVDAILRESLRIHPVAPMCMPRRLQEDDVYQAYALPKHAVVIPNVWAMMHDPSMYPEPGKFNPDRFLHNGQLDPSVRDPHAMAFGFGRRQCPGRNLADAQLFLMMASILKVFSVQLPLDSQGKPYSPEIKYIPGMLSAPPPFPCSFIPRSPQSVALVDSAMATYQS